MPTALKISGRTGRHDFINDTYEPLAITHNDKPVWVARSVAPRYLYHSGKARWVLSKTLDDGSRCWAYIVAPANSQDPSVCGTSWISCDLDGEWRQDDKIMCTGVTASLDKFVQLRMRLDDEMRNYGLVEPQRLKELWSRLDYNGNGIVSLGEIDKLVVGLIAGGAWPTWLNNKPALLRAYEKTTLKDGDGDPWVEKKEFHALLLNMFWFSKLWQVFDKLDQGKDRRIDLNEFMHGLSKIGLHLSNDEVNAEFDKIDRNHGGQVLFVEFCAYVRKRVNPDCHAEFDADIVSGEKCTKTLRKARGHKATINIVVTRKTFADFDNLERRISACMTDHKKLLHLWHTMDYNGNNIVSLNEVGKLIGEHYPLLNHRPALMRAYQKTIKDGDGDAWVEKKEFKMLLANIFYFNKLYWLFMHCHSDAEKATDRRMTFLQFKWANSVCAIEMEECEALTMFKSIDRDGSGKILFDEYCKWFTSRTCPDALKDFVS